MHIQNARRAWGIMQYRIMAEQKLITKPKTTERPAAWLGVLFVLYVLILCMGI